MYWAVIGIYHSGGKTLAEYADNNDCGVSLNPML